MNSLISRTKPISQLLKPTSRTLVTSRFSTSSPTPSPHFEKPVSEEKQSKSRSALNLVAKTDTTGNSEASLGFIPKIINWCKTWRIGTGVNKPNEFQSRAIEPSPVKEDTRRFDEVPPLKKLTNEASPPRKHDLFTKDSFWSALQSFFKTKRGSEIVFNALSREQIADKLQKDGPLLLRPLQPVDIHHLVDLLITEKKWIMESPTKNPRFKLVSLFEESLTTTQPHNPTRLSSLFSSPRPSDNSQLRVSSIAPKKISEKSPDNSQLWFSSTDPKKISEKSPDNSQLWFSSTDPKKISEKSPDNSQLRVSSFAPNKISEKSPDNSQLRVSSIAPNKISEKSPDNSQSRVSSITPKKISEKSPDNSQSRVSSITPKKISEKSPDNSQLRVTSIAPKKISEKSRAEILSDCQKLLDEILSRHPDGYKTGLFKKQFQEKYGYALNHQKLGYPKLVSLLHIIPGVKVKGPLVFSDNVVFSPGKDDEVESLWEELGPVVKSDRSLNGSNGEYESAMSVEDEFSDSKKEEHSCSSNPVTLLDILGSRCSSPRSRETRETISRLMTAKPNKLSRQDH